ncbi:MAG TPA: YHS domain-containing (seleno)protein [Quisquiliibacterium sp.]|nr:YHS domain-containing (seleno)protein [Quisquiliibacterium sp.]
MMSSTPTSFRAVRTALLGIALVGALSGCGAIVTQNPSGSLRPVNAVQDSDDARLILKGADVVAYFTLGRYVQGNPAIKTVHDGVTFRFSSAEHKALFDAQPAKYVPQYGGFCANGIAYGIPWGGDADTWRVIDGKLYIFGGRGSQEAFELDVPGNRALADRYWNDEVRGTNSFWQRSKRLVWRVPHYKSGEELAAMVSKARASKP